ncbi:prepilin peptidase, partial [candidate division WOR-3 bacterium]|nr:prepilin peptidase [candidate division WOR-3 bacterium]
MTFILAAAAAALGLAFGSFFNVCIYRIPRRLSVVSPPSHCPRCRKPIRPRDNVPVLSWLLLRGRCRDCGQRFSGRYALVELLTGGLFLACYLRFGYNPATLKAMVFV